MRRLKILHCLESIGSGGVEQRRLSLARYLGRDQFCQALACAKVKGDFDKRLEAQGMAVYRIGVMGHPFNFRYYKKLFATIREFRPDIIHGAVFEGVISAVVGGLFFNVPIIVIEETSEPANRSWRGNWLLKILAGFADAAVATSPAVARYLTDTIHIRKRKVKLILNGAEPPVDPGEVVKQRLRQELGIQSTDFVIGFVGRLLDDHKLVSVLIQSFARVVTDYPTAPFKLLVVGDGPDRKMLEAVAANAGVSERVVFAGYQADPAPFYTVMNVFALLSAREGFGMAAVEAMFFGLPVIGSAVGGIKDIVVDGVTGFLVPPSDVQAASAAIGKVFQDTGARSKMGTEGYARAMNLFTSKRYAANVAALYMDLSRALHHAG